MTNTAEKQLADKILRGEPLPTDFEDLANIMAASYSQIYDAYVRMRNDFHKYACLVDDYFSELYRNTQMGKTSDNSWPHIHDKLCEETHLYVEYSAAPLNPHQPFSWRHENGQEKTPTSTLLFNLLDACNVTDEPPVTTKRGHHCSALISIGKDETAEVILSREGYSKLCDMHAKPTQVEIHPLLVALAEVANNLRMEDFIDEQALDMTMTEIASQTPIMLAHDAYSAYEAHQSTRQPTQDKGE
jgi:hypothetical protein